MKKQNKLLSSFMAALITISGFSYAATFNDMKNDKGQDHWSLPYVTDITAKGLVGGYSDGSFKPNKSVTRIESIVFICRLFPAETVKATYDANKSKWEAKLNENLIPDFAKSSVVFGLENNWYTEAYLKEFMNKTSKEQREAQRYEFAVYLVRALGWDKEMSNAAVVAYKDSASIPKQAVPYVEILGKKGVIATTGDFNPLKSVTRGEVAKMLSIAYPSSVKARGSSTTNTGTTTPPSGTTQTGTITMPSGTIVEGKINQIIIDNYNVILTITDQSGNLRPFTNRVSGVVISLDGKAAAPSDLKVGYAVKLYTDSTTLKGIEASSTLAAVNKNFEGEIVSVTSSKIRIKSGNIAEEYDFAANASIVKNGKAARISDLVSGDKISAKIQNSLVVSVDATTVKRTLRNVVIKSVTSYANGTATIIVTDERGEQYTLEFTVNSLAYKNNSKVGISSVAIGYEADVYASSNEILDITIYGAAKGTVIIGTITEIDFREDILYVKRMIDNQEVKVYLARSVVIVDQLTNAVKSIENMAKGDTVIINGYEGLNSFEATRVSFY